MKNKLFAAQMKVLNAKENIEKIVFRKKKGEIAFEFIIILAIMATLIFGGWAIFGDAVMAKINEISSKLRAA